MKSRANNFRNETLRENIICNLAWLKSQNRPQREERDQRVIKIVDLFCGCGGMSLGAQTGLGSNNLGTEILLGLDSQLSALEVYKQNFSLGQSKSETLDIREFIARSDLKKYTDVDLLLAGPPCQGHSSLNNHTRLKDTRNLLYLEAIKFIQVTNPKIAIIENVTNITNDQHKVVNQSKDLLAKEGYQVFELGIDAYLNFGLPQKRRRHLIVAILGESFDTSEITAEAPEKKYNLYDFIGDLATEYKERKGIFYTASSITETNRKRIEYLLKNNLYDLPNQLRPQCHQRKHSYKSMYGRLNWQGPAQTITSGFGSAGQGRYIHPDQPRTITPHEAARIQGFPDFFDFGSVNSRVQLQTMIANAVPPKIIAVIVDQFVKQGVL